MGGVGLRLEVPDLRAAAAADLRALLRASRVGISVTASTPGVEGRVDRRDRRLESRSSESSFRRGDDDSMLEERRALALLRASLVDGSVTFSTPGAAARVDLLDFRFVSLSLSELVISRRGERDVLRSPSTDRRMGDNSSLLPRPPGRSTLVLLPR